MGTCNNACPAWSDCAYEHKGNCDCVHQRKFKAKTLPTPPLNETLGEKGVRIMRANHLVMNDMDDPWQSLAFEFYNMLLEADEQIKLIPKLPEHPASTSIEKWMYAVSTGISGSIEILAENPKALQITIYQAMMHALEHGRGQRRLADG